MSASRCIYRRPQKDTNPNVLTGLGDTLKSLGIALIVLVANFGTVAYDLAAGAGLACCMQAARDRCRNWR